MIIPLTTISNRIPERFLTIIGTPNFKLNNFYVKAGGIDSYGGHQRSMTRTPPQIKFGVIDDR